MASFEIPYLLLLSLTPVYFCELKVSGETSLLRPGGFFFKRRGGGKEKSLVLVRTNRLERAFYTRSAQVYTHLCSGSLSPGSRTSRPVSPAESASPRCPDLRLRGAASRAAPAAGSARPGPKRPFPGTGGSFFDRGI